MPPLPLVDFDSLDLSKVVFTREQVYAALPQRYEFETIHGVLHYDAGQRLMVAYRDVRDDEWWCRGHLPGRPIFPGMLMMETAAQMAAFHVYLAQKSSRFVAFGGIDGVKFRGMVTPPCRIILVGKGVELRPRRTVCEAQAYVDGKMVFEGVITGLPVDS